MSDTKFGFLNLVSETILLFLLATPALAGRPLSTEDASVLEEGRCQVESWVDRSREDTNAWLVPACNFGAGIEWQVGGARQWAEGTGKFAAADAQAKTVFKPITDESPWGIGLVAGVVKDPKDEDHRGWEHPYAIVPLTFAAGEALIHLNAGWARNNHDRRSATLWGIAGELPATERLTLVAEAYGENSSRPFLRAGGRYSVVKDVFDVDLTIVTRPGGDRSERFVSLGVFWQSGRFLK